MRCLGIFCILLASAVSVWPREVELVSPDTEWKYFDHRNPPAGWTDLAYDDFFWKAGRTPLGYGLHFQGTQISQGNDDEYLNVAAYFRKRFHVTNPERLQGLRLELHCWDGAVVYLNGWEIARVGMPDGDVTQNTYALRFGETTYNGAVDPAFLQPGENVLAVEVHKHNDVWPVLGMDAALWGQPAGPEVIDVEVQPEAVYFLLDTPLRVAVYELAPGAWLPVMPVENLIGKAKHLTVSEDGIFVASDTRVVHRDAAAGEWNSFPTNRSTSFAFLGSWPGHLAIGDEYLEIWKLPLGSSPKVTRSTNEFRFSEAAVQRGDEPEFYEQDSSSLGAWPQRLRLTNEGAVLEYRRNTAVPADVVTSKGLHPSSRRGILITRQGAVYSEARFEELARLVNPVLHAAFTSSNEIVVATNDALIGYDLSFRETGRLPLAGVPHAMVREGDRLVLFQGTDSGELGIAAESVSLGELGLPGSEPAPASAPAAVQAAFISGDTLYLPDSARNRLNRFSLTGRTYLTPFGLEGSPVAAVPVEGRNRAFYTTASRDLWRLDLNSGTSTRVVEGTVDPAVLATTGDAVAAWNNSRVQDSGEEELQRRRLLRLYSADGTRLPGEAHASFPSWPLLSGCHGWLFYRDGSIQGIAAPGGGGLGGGRGLPVEGFPMAFEAGGENDSRRGVTSFGEVMDVDAGTVLGRLPGFRDDRPFEHEFSGTVSAVWNGEDVIGIGPAGDDTQVTRYWASRSSVVGSTLAPGRPLHVLAHGDKVIVVSSYRWVPRIHCLDGTLNVLWSEPRLAVAPENLVLAGRSADAMTIEWDEPTGSAEAFQVEYRSSGEMEWQMWPTELPGSFRQANLQGFPDSQSYVIRMRARNALGVSDPTGALPVAAAAYLGGPYDLRAIYGSSTSVTLTWDDRLTNESGFRVLWKGAGQNVEVVELPAGTRQHRVEGLTPSTAYVFWVEAFTGGLLGDRSEAAKAVTLSRNDAPPEGRFQITDAEVFSDGFWVSWEDSFLNEDGYLIELGQSVAELAEIARTGAGESEIRIEGLEPAAHYFIRITAYNGFGLGATTGSTQWQTLPAAEGFWIGKCVERNRILYFAIVDPGRIERFDLQTGSWLEPWRVSGPVLQFWADARGLLATIDDQLVELDENGAARVLHSGGLGSVDYFSVGERIYVGDQLVLDRNTGQVLQGNAPEFPAARGIALDSGERRAYGVRDSGRLVRMEFDSDGDFVGSAGEESFFWNWNPDRVYLLPGEQLVAPNSGPVLRAEDLGLEASLGGPFQDLAFTGDGYVILRDSELVRLGMDFDERGRLSVGTGLSRIAVAGGAIYCFGQSARHANGIEVRTASFDELRRPVSAEPLYGQGNVFAPDVCFADRSDIVWMGAFSARHFFRWSLAENAYVEPRPLTRIPVAAAYSGEAERVYTAYKDAITVMDAADPLGIERPFALPLHPPVSIAAADSWVLAAKNPLAFLYDAGGTVVDISVTPLHVRFTEWSPFLRRALFLPERGSGSYRSIAPDGMFDLEGVLPFGLAAPLVPKPGSGIVMTGAGVSMNAQGAFGYTTGPRLGNAFDKGSWLGGELFTLRKAGSNETEIQRWTGAAYSLTESRTIAGEPNAIVAAANKLIVVTMIEGAPCIRYISAGTLADEFVSPRRPASPWEPRVTQRSSSSLRLAWTDSSDNETGFEIEYREKQAASLWRRGALVGPGVAEAQVPGLVPGVNYVLRVFALSEAFRSEPSEEVETSTVASDDLPGGEPYHLRAIEVFASRVVLQWDDHAANESGFRILRSRVGAAGGGEDVTRIAGANTTVFSDTGLTPGATYDYRVEAFNAAGTGERSAAVRVTTPFSDVLSEEDRPSGFVVVESGVDFVMLRWRDESAHEEGFILERRREDGGGEYAEIARLPSNTTEYTDSGLEPGVVYLYILIPYNSLGRSEFYAEQGAETLRLGGDFIGLMARRGSILYFAMTQPDALQRYDLSTREWLAPLETSDNIQALWADADAVFFMMTSGIWRWEDGEEGPVYVRPAGSLGYSIFTAGRKLYAFSGREYDAVDKFTGAARGTIPVNSGLKGVIAVPSESGHRIAGGAFALLRFGPNDAFIDYQFAPGLPRFGVKCEPNGDGSFASGNDGLVYRLDPLEVAGSLGSGWDDLAFWGERPVKLHGGEIVIYEDLERGREMARGAAPPGAVALEVQGDEALVFQTYAGVESGLLAHRVDLPALQFPVAPGPAIRGDELSLWRFQPFAGQRSLVVGDTVCFLLPGEPALARYDWRDGVFLDSVPLLGEAVGVAAAREMGSVVLWYEDGLLTTLDLSATQPREGPFASAVQPVIVRLGLNAMEVQGISEHAALNALLFRHDDEQRLVQVRSPNSWEAPLDSVWSPDGEWYVTRGGDVISTEDGNILAELLPGAAWDARISTAVAGGSLVSARSAQDQGSLSEIVLYDENFDVSTRVYLMGIMPAVHALPDGGVVVLTLDRRENNNGNIVRILTRGPGLEPLTDSIGGIPPVIIRQPQSRPAGVGEEALFRVEVISGTRLTYQWWKGWEAIPGATSPELILRGLTQDDSGVYRVEATNMDGSVFSRFAELRVGASAPWFTAGNLLAVRRDQLLEISRDGDVVQSMTIPPAVRNIFGLTTLPGQAVIVDRFNGIHVLQAGSATDPYYLASYEPWSGEWRFLSNSARPNERVSFFYLASRGEEILGPGTAFRIWEGSSVEFAAYPDRFPENAVFNGAGGNIFSVRGGVIAERDPSTWETMQEFSIGASRRTTADAAGDFFTVSGDSSQLISRWRRTEEEWVSLNPGGYRLTNVSAAPDGLLATGADSGHVILTDTELSIPRVIELPGAGPAYVHWTPRNLATAIEPGLEAGAVEWDAAAGYYRQTITVTGPARSNFHHFELVVSGLPDSVRLANFDPRAEGPEIRLPYAGPGVDGPGRTVVQLLFDSLDGVVPGDLGYELRWLDPNFGLVGPLLEEGSDGRIFATFPTIPGWHYRLERTKDFLSWQPATDPLPAAANQMTWELPRGGDLELFRAAGSPP